MSAPITEERLAEIEARALRRATACVACALHNEMAADGRPARSLWRCEACGSEVCEAHRALNACWCASEGVAPRYASTTTAGADALILAAEVRRLTAALAAHQRFTDAAVDGVRAMLPSALEIARREGAEAMRERCVAACERVERRASEALDDVDRGLVDLYVGKRDAADDCADAIRALPLDAPGGES